MHQILVAKLKGNPEFFLFYPNVCHIPELLDQMTVSPVQFCDRACGTLQYDCFLQFFNYQNVGWVLWLGSFMLVSHRNNLFKVRNLNWEWRGTPGSQLWGSVFLKLGTICFVFSLPAPAPPTLLCIWKSVKQSTLSLIMIWPSRNQIASAQQPQHWPSYLFKKLILAEYRKMSLWMSNMIGCMIKLLEFVALLRFPPEWSV